MTDTSLPPESQPTAWSVVLRAADAKDPHFRTALNRLCEMYWRPAYVYARRRGLSPEESEDAVQGFFAAFIERDCLAGITREGGRFRSFMLTSLDHYLIDRRRRARARDDGALTFRLDFARAEAELTIEAPQVAYERSWAEATLARAFDALCREFEYRGQRERFDLLSAHLTGERASYEEIARKLSMTVSDVRDLLHRTRERLRRLVREAVRETVAQDSEVDEEVRALFKAL